MADPIWFWQDIVSPHMVDLAKALARNGREVTYVAEQSMSATRAADGWQAPSLKEAQLRFAPDMDAMTTLVAEAPGNSIHICQGFRGNGLLGATREALARQGLRQWVIMETVDEHGWIASRIKRLEYTRLIRSWRGRIEGILSIGHATPLWLSRRGMPRERIFAFSYFLGDGAAPALPDSSVGRPFRVLFVGRFVRRKRLDMLIDALTRQSTSSFELAVAGSGPLEQELRSRAQARLCGDVLWLGQRPTSEIPALMAGADCLVLPSRFDGWGAVVSEALIAGTPAICSDGCGSAEVVRASGSGGVFPAGDVEALAGCLRRVIADGPLSAGRRAALAAWAYCLSATAGAKYLEAVLHYTETGEKEAPLPPWLCNHSMRNALCAD